MVFRPVFDLVRGSADDEAKIAKFQGDFPKQTHLRINTAAPDRPSHQLEGNGGGDRKKCHPPDAHSGRISGLEP
jgi:hypothetical protein